MRIQKLGHCCLRIEVQGKVLLTDPGSFSTAQNTLTGIDAVLITHEHGDHFHIDSLKAVLSNNPQVDVITNGAVGKLLEAEGIAHTIIEGRNKGTVGEVMVEAFDGKHEEIFEDIGQVQNTGYLIGDTLFYPGDAFCIPEVPVEVLALPVAGPWCKLSDAIRFALKVSPKKAFPVHDGTLQEGRGGMAHSLPKKILEERGIAFTVLKEGEEAEF